MLAPWVGGVGAPLGQVGHRDMCGLGRRHREVSGAGAQVAVDVGTCDCFYSGWPTGCVCLLGVVQGLTKEGVVIRFGSVCSDVHVCR